MFEIYQDHVNRNEKEINSLKEYHAQDLMPIEQSIERVRAQLKEKDDEINKLRFNIARYIMTLKKHNLIDPEGAISIDHERAKTVELVETYQISIQNREDELNELKQKLSDTEEQYEAQIELFQMTELKPISAENNQHHFLPQTAISLQSNKITPIFASNQVVPSKENSITASATTSRRGSNHNILAHILRPKARIDSSSSRIVGFFNDDISIPSGNHLNNAYVMEQSKENLISSHQQSVRHSREGSFSNMNAGNVDVCEYYDQKIKFQRLMNEREMNELFTSRERMKKVWKLRFETLEKIYDKKRIKSVLDRQEKWLKYAAKYFPKEEKQRNIELVDAEVSCNLDGYNLYQANLEQSEKARKAWEYAKQMQSQGQSLASALMSGFNQSSITSKSETPKREISTADSSSLKRSNGTG
ncbi:hypothetical protein HK096_010467, partial [Nowakowskiella sp. JEL0078]